MEEEKKAKQQALDVEKREKARVQLNPMCWGVVAVAQKALRSTAWA